MDVWAKNMVKMTLFQIKFECQGLDDTTEAFLRLKNRSPFTSSVLDLAATLFCGLKHVTHPSIGKVVSRYGVNLYFWVNYPFNLLQLFSLVVACLLRTECGEC